MSLALAPSSRGHLPALLFGKEQHQWAVAPSRGAHPTLSLAGIPRAQLASLQPSGGSPADHWEALGKTNGFSDARWLSAKSRRWYQSSGCCHPGPLSLQGPGPPPVTSDLWVSLTCRRQGLLLPWALSEAKSLVPEAPIWLHCVPCHYPSGCFCFVLFWFDFGQGRAPWGGWGTTAEILVIHKFVYCFILCKALY